MSRFFNYSFNKAINTFFRWKPRLSSAGDEFCKAAILFYQMGEVEASKTNLLRACDCFKKKRAWYSAAKTLEQAMAITHKQVRSILIIRH